ncbi:TPA: hCG2045411-like [Bos taurus]|nr:TPA: hCG2045411-like [Bos taurus]
MVGGGDIFEQWKLVTRPAHSIHLGAVHQPARPQAQPPARHTPDTHSSVRTAPKDTPYSGTRSPGARHAPSTRMRPHPGMQPASLADPGHPPLHPESGHTSRAPPLGAGSRHCARPLCRPHLSRRLAMNSGMETVSISTKSAFPNSRLSCSAMVPAHGLRWARTDSGPPRLQWVLLDLGCPESAGGLAAGMG